MIVPMMKYSLVLYHKEYMAFLEKLQELGLVDITTAAWEPGPDDRKLMDSVEKHRKMVAALRSMAEATALDPLAPKPDSPKMLGTTEKAFETYDYAAMQIESLRSEQSRLRKEVEELRPWGTFSRKTVSQLEQADIKLHFYILFIREFDRGIDTWKQKYVIQEISRDMLYVYFVVAAPVGEIPDLGAEEVKAPESDYLCKIRALEKIQTEINTYEARMAQCIPYLDVFEPQTEALVNELNLHEVARSGARKAEGTLILLEGWATAKTQEKVDAMLDKAGVFYLKDKPAADDATPVMLKNNKFSSLFETIGNFYAIPKYGTTDLTPYFGPFYALFFGFCLGDAGYGLIYVLAGIFIALKFKESMGNIGWLVTCCGIGAIIFGILTGSFFGIQLAEQPIFEGMKEIFLDENSLFTLALGLGFVHLLFGMSIRVAGITRRQGIRYALSTLGWMLVILSSLAAFLLPGIGIAGFTTSSTAYPVMLAVGLFMMLFLNSPGKNPLVNFGTGLWNTYNDITGLLSDVLSYIRLFALGLSGAILALVFNDLAVGMSPNIPVVKQLVMLVILLAGHGINLFMSSLGSFVHPMRLTFVEFYKNAGFEASQRRFKPLKKEVLTNDAA